MVCMNRHPRRVVSGQPQPMGHSPETEGERMGLGLTHLAPRLSGPGERATSLDQNHSPPRLSSPHS